MPIFSCSKRYTQVIRKSNVDQQQGKRGFLLLKHRLRCLACFGSKRIGGCSLTFLEAVGSVQAENELSILPFSHHPYSLFWSCPIMPKGITTVLNGRFYSLRLCVCPVLTRMWWVNTWHSQKPATTLQSALILCGCVKQGATESLYLYIFPEWLVIGFNN